MAAIALNIAADVLNDQARTVERVVAEILEDLQSNGALHANHIERGYRAAEASGERIDIVLNKLGLVSDADLLAAYRKATGLDLATADRLAAPLCPPGIEPIFLRHVKIVPLEDDGEHIVAALADPLDLRPINALSRRLGRRPRVLIAERAEIEAALARMEPNAEASGVTSIGDIGNDDIDRLRDVASEAPIIRLATELIEASVDRRASDIHITRSAEAGRVRLRLDGRLTDLRFLTPRIHQALVSRYKIMAALDIGERRLPQDGRIQVPVKGREIDLRVSTMPHAHGEGIFIRVLDNTAAALDLQSLGFSSEHVGRIETILGHAHGIFLITGPTGSGKTTTLYAALRHLNDPSRNIVTVEDPIEYTLPGINQIQVNRRAGLDFARTLRSVLRQDPDVIMVGEIRDRETAAIAVQAALTGHFVLATLHTNDALSAIDRLFDMEVEPFLLGSVLRGLMAQRLVRKCCPCENDRSASSSDSMIQCEKCHGTGFSGRIPLAEVVPTGEVIQRRVAERRIGRDLSSEVRAMGYEDLEVEGRRLVAARLTTLPEIHRALGE